MGTLDEDLLNKITYLPECQATFKKYKASLKKGIAGEIGVILVISIFFFLLFHLIVFNPNSSIQGIGKIFIFIVFVGVMLFLWMAAVQSLINSIKDLNAKNLDIKTDIYSKTLVSQGQLGRSYQGIFQEAGKIEIPGMVAGALEQDTKVYIVRTVYSKTVLDIIPADKIENKL